MDNCQVLVIGGGPGGSTCAWQLARAGVDVMLIDRQHFPRTKPCAGWITPQVVELLQLDCDAYRRFDVLQPLTGFRVGTIGSPGVEVHYDRPVSYGIRRCQFDDFLLRRCGARLRLGEAVRSVERIDGRWVVNDAVAASMLVAAGGHFCPVARQLGARADRRSTVIAAQEIEFAVPAEQRDRLRVAPEVAELYFCRDLTGYGWCFRKGDHLNVGMGRTDGNGLAGHVAEFIAYLRQQRQLGCDVPPRLQGHAYQLYERVVPKLFDDGVLLVGDAAGLADPRSGEGIRPAIESGLIAAETILAAEGRFNRQRLAPYAEQLRRRIGRPRRGSVADRLPASLLRPLGRRLLANRRFVQRVVLDRWFLRP